MKTTAKFILSRSRAIQQYNKIKNYSDIISYSYKTNQEIGKILCNKTDCFFSVHSIESIAQLNSSKRVIFFVQSSNNKDYNDLFSRGIDKFVVDNINDLNSLLAYINEKNKKITLFLRLRLKEHTVHTGKHFVYGMYSSQINEVIPALKKNPNILKLGIHFHRKTQNVSEWSLKDELKDSIDHWGKLDYLNIGGGLPVEYKNFRSSVLDNILKKISELKTWLNKQNIKMIIEPGRFVAAYPIGLETTIINIYNNNIVVNCSIFNAAIDTWIANIRLLVEGELESGKAYTIKGCSPDSADIFRYKVYLEEPKIGDKIVFLNAGAYNFCCDFCNLPKLKTEIVD
ncbi:decarboxylase [Candidatus Woesearchaeota archaeon]|nr:decarboxylase [Candidatus Woesearchaeota archaeon]